MGLKRSRGYDCRSIRRKKAEVGDIEIVAVPKMGRARGAGLFADTEFVYVNLLDELMQKLLNLSQAIVPGDRTKDGRKAPFSERYYKFRYDGYQFDLFVVLPPAEWGIIFVIRTGPAMYSKWLVTEALYKGMQVVDGQLWRIVNGQKLSIISCPEEKSFFRALDILYEEPEKRIAR